MSGRQVEGQFIERVSAKRCGVTSKLLSAAVSETYRLIDKVDATLTEAEAQPLSQIVELANLSSMLGNILGGAIAHNSDDLFKRNGPHKFPDLLSNKSPFPDVEIKMALEGNKPKGHLAKPGHYIVCRYVLCDANGNYKLGKENRGITPYIWELRFGLLENDHFNISNTAGDSGKTAVVNAAGMNALEVVYVDLNRAPLSKKGRTFKDYEQLLNGIS